MALYLDRYITAGFGTEREHTVVRRRTRLVDGMFEGAWTLQEAVREARMDYRSKPDGRRNYVLRVLTGPDEQ